MQIYVQWLYVAFDPAAYMLQQSVLSLSVICRAFPNNMTSVSQSCVCSFLCNLYNLLQTS